MMVPPNCSCSAVARWYRKSLWQGSRGLSAPGGRLTSHCRARCEHRPGSNNLVARMTGLSGLTNTQSSSRADDAVEVVTKLVGWPA
jgi:hypothetical protein